MGAPPLICRDCGLTQLDALLAGKGTIRITDHNGYIRVPLCADCEAKEIKRQEDGPQAP